MPRGAKPYAWIAKRSLETLPKTVAARRSERGLSLREAAKEIGVGTMTLHRIEAGGDASVRVLLKVFAWLDGDKP